jgi:hypothetical protein
MKYTLTIVLIAIAFVMTGCSTIKKPASNNSVAAEVHLEGSF